MYFHTWTSVCCLFLAVQLAASVPKQDETARKAIMKILTDQQDSWNKGDLKSFMQGYARSDDITFYSAGTVQRGYDAVFERYKKRYQAEGKEMGKVTFSEIDVTVLGQDSAVVRGRWDLKMSKEMPGGLFTLIVRKTPEGWRIVHDHTSSREQ
jgi:beta-aspartyl-peptidase (threonine type)